MSTETDIVELRNEMAKLKQLLIETRREVSFARETADRAVGFCISNLEQRPPAPIIIKTPEGPPLTEREALTNTPWWNK